MQDDLFNYTNAQKKTMSNEKRPIIYSIAIVWMRQGLPEIKSIMPLPC